MNLSRNIVIEASAGTGKTYTLVQTILQALFEKNLPMESLVAMTFTKKAAGEMKERIAAELQKIDAAEAIQDAWKPWGHGLSELKIRAREALETIDRAAIGTIHSYAFSLLKRFPLEAGVNPSAEVDEKGIHGDDLFEAEWPAWLRGQLGSQSPLKQEWLALLERIPLKDVGTLARTLCDFEVPLDVLPLSGEGEDKSLVLLTKLLKPFAEIFRGKILAAGYLSNDALLVLARELVAKEFRVREILKYQIRLIFVDEFQDTDPLQGELILFLSEQPGRPAKKWKDISLEPGKLFLVGDPKQSIYRFRGADIAAYKRITEMVLEQGGLRHSLDESYRSHDQIIHAVNAAFTSLMQEKAPVSPAYQTLIPLRTKDNPEKQGVEIRLAAATSEQSSDEALEQEAEDAARWIAEAQAGKQWNYKDIALIFRATPAMTSFVEALRKRDIPFVVEAERYFYRTPEVTDVLNLLRILEDPNNRIALVGFLRSPLGGFTDAELVTLQSKNGIRLMKPLPPELDSPAHHAAWELLRGLRRRVDREPLKNILRHVYDDSYLLELAARSYHRDQTIANLLKLKRLMETFGEEGETTLGGLLSKIDRFMENDRLEGEYPLADETYDAVRLLTVHKAKGLEFPVVWLPGLHRGRGTNRAGHKIAIHYDWNTGRVGLAMDKELKSLDCAALEEDVKLREAAEELRVLYVAMTRAKERLILSGGIDLKRPSKDAFLSMLAGVWKLDLEKLENADVKVGETTLSVRKIDLSAKTSAASLPKIDWLNNIKPNELADRWEKQEKVYEKGMETRRVVTPTQAVIASPPAIGGRGDPPVTAGGLLRPASEDRPRNDGRMLGTLVHRFLETWDFSCEKCDMPLKLRHVANNYFANLGLLKEPFPDPKLSDKTNNSAELTETVDEAQRLLADFIGSDAEEEIKTSTIIGREVPFFYSAGDALMRGAMDILYRLPSGQVVVGDYKTDKEPDPKRYEAQGAAYAEAVSRALGEKAVFKLIYLRDTRAEVRR